ncbi:hypothetical protein QH637_03400 [Heyndrickxia coagulans]
MSFPFYHKKQTALFCCLSLFLPKLELMALVRAIAAPIRKRRTPGTRTLKTWVAVLGSTVLNPFLGEELPATPATPTL